jgi:ABC-2 type transport system permease protein
MIRNLAWARNPFFPEATQVFGRGPFSEVQQERWRRAHSPTPAEQPIPKRLAAAARQILVDWRFGFLLIPAGIASILFSARRRESIFLVLLLIAFAVMAACLIALGMILFGASFPKAPVSLVLTLLLGGVCFAALGVAITGFIRRAEGASAVINAIYLPVAFISGAFFSQQHFPEVLRRVADVLPLTYFIDLVGDVMLKGTQIWNEPKDVAVILAWGIAGAVISLRYFRWVPRED